MVFVSTLLFLYIFLYMESKDKGISVEEFFILLQKRELLRGQESHSMDPERYAWLHTSGLDFFATEDIYLFTFLSLVLFFSLIFTCCSF